jgi:hypothetical protein
MQEKHTEDATAVGEGPGREVPRRQWLDPGSAPRDRSRRHGPEAVEDEGEMLRSAQRRVSATYGWTARRVGRVYREALEYAHDHPAAAVVTFAAGLGAGMLVAGRDPLRIYRRGLLPVVAVALADAVLEVFGEQSRR